MDYWKNNKRRVLTTAAVGAAGAAAAYYCYYRWWQEPPEARNAAAEQGGGDAGTSASVPGRTKAPTDPDSADADADLQHHYETMQEIGQRSAVPEMLPRLMERLCARTDVDAITDRLRQARGTGAGGEAAGGSMAAADKYAAWQELKVLSFTRCLAAMWAVPLLDLLLRCQLSVLGRHLYMARAVPADTRPFAAPGEGPLPVDSRAQDGFMRLAAFLQDCGLEVLVGSVRQAVSDVVGPLSLREPLGLPQLLGHISAANAQFEGLLLRMGPPTFLMPLPERLPEFCLAAVPATAGPHKMTDADVGAEVDAVASMGQELRLLVGSPLFAAALQAALREASAVLDGYLGTALGASSPSSPNGGALPLAKVLPLVAAGPQELLSQQQALAERVAALPQVQQLCAAGFAGPTPC